MFDQVRGNPIIARGFPEVKLSKAVLSSFTNGSESNSSMVGTQSMTYRPAGDTVFSLE